MSTGGFNSDDEMISGINVTPLVDVVLVLLVVLMVTATYVASRSIPVDLPRAATSEATASVLAIALDRDGTLYLDGAKVSMALLRERVRQARLRDPEVRAIIAADEQTRHGRVVVAIDMLRQEGVSRFAINVEPEALEARTPRAVQ